MVTSFLLINHTGDHLVGCIVSLDRQEFVLRCFAMPNTLDTGDIAKFELDIVHDKIRELWGGLYSSKLLNNITYRYAPSIIVRGECEILGQSSPRFAVRATIPGVGIVNLRRKKCLREALSSQGQADIIDKVFTKPYTNKEKRWESYFADCLLVPPDTSKHSNYYNYHFITTNLWEAYGEDKDKWPNRAVPFMNHVRFGGGVCAQAVCFIASLLCQKQIKSIHGVPEITEISRQKQPGADDGRLNFSEGLVAPNIRNYFRRSDIGLYSFYERYDQVAAGVASPDGSFSSEAIGCIAFALKSYVLSGVPVILPVKPDVLRSDGDPRNLHHCVLVSGVSRFAGGVNRNEKDDFVVTDTAGLPFQRYSIDRLTQASKILKNNASFKETYGVSASAQHKNFDILHMIPVLPKEIRLPFLTDDEDFMQGEQDPSLAVRNEHSVSSVIRQLSLNTEQLECRLVKWAGDELHTLEGFDHSHPYFLGNWKSIFENCFKEKFLPGNRWYWIVAEKGDNNHFRTVYVIDAEFERPDSNDDQFVMNSLQSLKKLEISLPSNGVTSRPDSNPPISELPEPNYNPPTSELPVDGKFPVPEIVLLSSFSVKKTFKETIAEWGEVWPRPKKCELYTFMKSTADDLQNTLKQTVFSISGTNLNAADFLAECGRDGGKIMQRSEIVAELLNKWCDRRVQIVSFASFLPWLSRYPESDQAKAARDALFFLAYVCFQLRKYGHLIQKIELVSGSRMIGFHDEAFPAAPPKLCAQMMPARLARQNLIDNLAKTIERIKRIHKNIFPHCIFPCFALEAEPGPLFSLPSDISSISSFCEEIDTAQNITPDLRYAGLNLDISHWAISRNNSDQSSQKIYDLSRFNEEYPHVFKRICGAHISDSHRAGHFGDIQIFQKDDNSFLCSNIQELGGWIRLLARKMEYDKEYGDDPPFPRFDGNLGLELEAIASIFSIPQSFSALKGLLYNIRSPSSSLS